MQKHRNLGEIVSHDLKTTTHSNALAVKGFSVLSSLRQAFQCFDGMFQNLYPIYVIPYLKHCIQAASLGLIRNTDARNHV